MPEGVGRPTSKRKPYKPGSMIDYDKSATRIVARKPEYKESDIFTKRERRPEVKSADKNAGIRALKRTQVTPGKWKSNG